MRLSDYCIYEFDVEFTQTITHRDQCGDAYETSKHPGTKSTIRILADSYHDGFAIAVLNSMFRHQEEKDMKIIATRRLELDAIVEVQRR